MVPRHSVLLIAFVALSGPARPQCFEVKLQAAGGSAEDRFGIQVLQQDDVLFVAEEGADASGRVRVYAEQPEGWLEVTSFAPAAARPGLRFGATLAADGDVLLAGSRDDDGSGLPAAGGAWIFVRDRQATPTPLDDRWVELQPLEITDPWTVQRFGRSVALCDGTALVGTPELVGAPRPAAVYVFVRDDRGTRTQFDDRWIQQARLDPDPATANSYLGAYVALIDGGALALASDSRDRTGANGGVFLYARDDHGSGDPFDDTWRPAGQVEASAGDADALVGNFIVDGERLFAAGSFVDAGSGAHSSCIDVYERTGPDWNFAQRLVGPLASLGGYGQSMAADGDLLITGGLGSWNGPAFDGRWSIVFARTGGTWELLTKMQAPDQSVRDRFGNAVDLAGSRAWLGAPGGPYDDDDPAAEGAVYVTELLEPNGWTALSDKSPPDPSLAGWGRLDGASTVTLRIYDTFYDGNLVLLVAGTREVDLPIGDDLLVPAPELLVPLVLGAEGDVAVSGSWPPGLPAGFSMWFQAWVATGFESNPWSVSNGLRVTQTPE